jgi:predicted dienelactone hydrolase
VVVWSHGVFGSHEGYEPLVRAWVEAGYVVVQPTHDDSLLGLSRKEIRAKAAAPALGIWRERPKDIALVLDTLPTLDEAIRDAPPLDLDRIGMGGHSFGAYTAMLVAGVASEREHLDDPRPEAFVWISPTGIGGQGPGDGKFLDGDLDPVDRPVLFLTGSKDEAKVRKQTPAWRLTSWRALDAPATLWFVEDGHHNFGGISGRVLPDTGPADPALVGWVAAATTAFWDVHLRGRPVGPWLEPAAALARSEGRVRVEHKPLHADSVAPE